MKTIQPKLVLAREGNILIDSTNTAGSAKKMSNKRKRENIENIEPIKNMRKDGIFIDLNPTSLKNASVSVQTDFTPDQNTEDKVQMIKDMLTCETPPAEYWQRLAERRKKDLNVALVEVKTLREENIFLKKEKVVMEEMLDEAKQLALLVQDMTEDSSKTGDDCNVEL